MKEWIKQLRQAVNGGRFANPEHDAAQERRMLLIYGKQNRWASGYEKPAYLRRAKMVGLSRFA